MQTHSLKRNINNRKSRRVGRGATRGKTSGRGTKGQKARAGHKIRPAIRDIIKKIPKRRGYAFKSIEVKPIPLALGRLGSHFEAGSVVSPLRLVEAGLVPLRRGRAPKVKILGDGEISTKLIFENVLVSGSARKKIEGAGGEIK